MKRIGLAVMRCQPMHLGHVRVLQEALEKCDTVILALGSHGISDERNPWSSEIRKEMVKNIFGNSIHVIHVEDLPRDSSEDWCSYVLKIVELWKLPKPTDYFAGSHEDAFWYREHFESDAKFLDGSSRKLHCVDRELNEIPSATEIRAAIFSGDVRFWQKWVPRANWNIVTKILDEQKICV